MHKLLLSFISLLLFSSLAIAGNGLIHTKSSHDVKTTADRLEMILESKGMTLFNRINHAEAAEKAGKTLRPTELIIFGNPNVGTPLMQCRQSIAIDLPQKALIWEDQAGDVWISYNSPEYLAKRHTIKGCEKVITKIDNALASFSKAAAR